MSLYPWQESSTIRAMGRMYGGSMDISCCVYTFGQWAGLTFLWNSMKWLFRAAHSDCAANDQWFNYWMYIFTARRHHLNLLTQAPKRLVVLAVKTWIVRAWIYSWDWQEGLLKQWPSVWALFSQIIQGTKSPVNFSGLKQFSHWKKQAWQCPILFHWIMPRLKATWERLSSWKFNSVTAGND